MNTALKDTNQKHQQVETKKIGVLITNLGTPDAPTATALKPYLKQFLSDRRVVDLNPILWWFILNFIILRKRPAESAKLYQKIWAKDGSPLLIYTKRQAELIQIKLRRQFGEQVIVEIGMRYGNPSIESGLEKLKEQGARKILVLPMYPQYAAATSASTFDAVADTLKNYRWVPELRTIMSFHESPLYIKALTSCIEEAWQERGKPEMLLFSYHGIPQRYFDNGDPYYCYCHKTTRLVAAALGLEPHQYKMSFQSRFGKEEWLKPYTDEVVKELGRAHTKSLHVVCPGFSADCLETIEEIDGLNREFFEHAGGGDFYYIPALNVREDFMSALADLCATNLGGWVS